VQQPLNPAYLRDQYSTTAKLDIRIEAHQRYSERADDFLEWVLDRLDPQPGNLVLDVGCGKGSFHPVLARRGVRAVAAVDLSAGMVAASQRQANELGLPVVALEASAERMPFPDGSFDRAMANHVLFLVPDVRGALREIGRVLKAGGRAVLTTNAPDHSPRLHALHRAAADALGYRAQDRVLSRFHLDDVALVAEVFPNPRRFVREDAFVFPTAEAAVRYYASGMVDAIVDPPPDGSHRARLIPVVAEEIQSIIAREGVFRDPKNAGCFVVTLE
jgi:ubiquinone/menaquinone biosynthesis C-methylase UbiE